MIRDWMRMLLAVLMGNVIYFAAEPFLPETLVHNLYQLDRGIMIDFAICAGVYLLIRKPAGGSPTDSSERE